MKLKNKDYAFELTILGYQFPELDQALYDSNWLMVQVKVIHPQGTWQATDPALLTYELRKLITWLSQLATGNFSQRELDFLEPNLAFALKLENQHPYLYIYFEMEMRPEWAPLTHGLQYDLWVAFALSETDLPQAIQDLQAQYQQLPQRAER
jgi:hypothetical protein